MTDEEKREHYWKELVSYLQKKDKEKRAQRLCDVGVLVILCVTVVACTWWWIHG